jgi:hypothetical protein
VHKISSATQSGQLGLYALQPLENSAAAEFISIQSIDF